MTQCLMVLAPASLCQTPGELSDTIFDGSSTSKFVFGHALSQTPGELSDTIFDGSSTSKFVFGHALLRPENNSYV